MIEDVVGELDKDVSDKSVALADANGMIEMLLRRVMLILKR